MGILETIRTELYEDMEIKKYAIHSRTSRRTKWQYAEYGGRYESVDEALTAAEQHYGIVPFEYQIEDITTGEMVKTGFVNWEGK